MITKTPVYLLTYPNKPAQYFANSPRTCLCGILWLRLMSRTIMKTPVYSTFQLPRVDLRGVLQIAKTYSLWRFMVEEANVQQWTLRL